MRLVALFLLTSSAVADEATVLWDHDGTPDGVRYRLYLDGVPLSEHGTSQATIVLPENGGELAVSAFTDKAKSAKSEPVIIPAAPTNVTVTITTTIGAP